MPTLRNLTPFCRHLLCVVLLCSLWFSDLFVTVLSLGFYNGGRPFSNLNISRIWDYSSLKDGYSFISSPFDFLILLLLRSLLLFFIPVLYFRSPLQRDNPEKIFPKFLNFFLIGLQICNFSFSLVKLLAFSELDKQLHFLGVWLNIIWNIFAFICVHALYEFCLFRKNCLSYSPNLDANSAYHPLLNNSNDLNINNGGTDGSSSNFSSLNGHQQSSNLLPLRISTWEHIRCLLGYCLYVWNWLLVGFLFLIVTIFGGLRAGTLNYTTAQINLLMRRDLFRSIISQEIAFFDQAQTGEILSRLISDCETMSATISTNVNVLLRNGLMVIGSVVFMMGMSWRLTLLTVIVIPPITFFTKLYSSYYDSLSEKTQQTKSDANRVAEEVVGCMRNIRSFASEQKEKDRFEWHLFRTLEINKKKSMALAGFQWVNELANNCILVAILSYGGHLVLSGRMTADQMLAFMLYQLQLGENFYMLNSVGTSLMECVGASRKVFEYMKRVPKIKLEKGELMPEKDLSFSILPGEVVALVGPSGAGKSSIIALLEHFYEPLFGQILLDDSPIDLYEHRYFHKIVSLVSQEPTLYACSVRENILYGCEENEYTMDDVIKAAKLANIHNFVINSEFGYETKCGENGVQMSGGQKQRIAIARALVRNPVVLILDEATSALDSESEHVIQESIMLCKKGRTVLLIAHRLSTVERADRIIVLNEGNIVQMGSHSELMDQTEGLYNKLVKRQLLGNTNNNDPNI
uniref:ABC transmembrane type-1 domain-containing protein n=1 Tax=Meloidogyne hapla TaxID=6305 RepID=A0A1I8AYT8_MELHA